MAGPHRCEVAEEDGGSRRRGLLRLGQEAALWQLARMTTPLMMTCVEDGRE
jgi:hypothetical protein